MDADEYLNYYLPEFNTAEKRAHLQQFEKEKLIEMLLMSYKNARVMAMTADLYTKRMDRIRASPRNRACCPASTNLRRIFLKDSVG